MSKNKNKNKPAARSQNDTSQLKPLYAGGTQTSAPSQKAASPLDTVKIEKAQIVRLGLPLPPETPPEANTGEYEHAKKELEAYKQAYIAAKQQVDLQSRNQEEEKASWESQQIQEVQAIQKQKDQFSHEKQTWELTKQEQKDALTAEKTALQTARQAFEGEKELDEKTRAEQRRQIDEANALLARQRKRLSEREEEIQRREADADAGFVEREEKALQRLQASHNETLARFTKIREQMLQHEREHAETLDREKDQFRRWLEQERKSWETQKQQQQQHDLQLLKSKRNELEQQESKIAQREAKVSADLKTVERKERHNEEYEKQIDDWIERELAKRYADIIEDNRILQDRMDDAHKKIREMEEHLKAKEDALEKMGVIGPEETIRKLQDLEKEKKRLQKELDNRPSGQEYEELKKKSNGLTDCQTEVWKKTAEIDELKRRLEGFEIEAMTVERLRDQKKAMEQNYALLKAELSSLKKEVDGYIQRVDDKPIFAMMTAMDQSEALKETIVLWPFEIEGAQPSVSKDKPPLSLSELVTRMRKELANDPEGKRPPLYYRDKDLRAFLGGMAMSRLLLLQGISGIGKSSLPRALGTIFGGQCQDISIQAGWRDKNDLFGYFNSFEKKYYESPIVQALYQAQMPHWEERIIFILFDEMNLSHPEQYAADILDVLERKDDEKRRFELVTFPVPKGQAPEKLEEGRYLRLPKNVWFVGTANHDETTKDFADKTYDRSFVMELPSEPVPFEQKEKSRNQYPLRYRALIETFEQAKQNTEHQKGVKNAKEWLKKNLRSFLAENFGVGWGGRFESQIESFLPVVMEAGGSIGEGLDQMLSMRLLRKLRGKHDNLPEHIERLRDVLEMDWLHKNRPENSIELLEKELFRLKR